MLTIFTTCRPFEGKFAAHQRNALMSWALQEPTPEIILFGNEPGSSEIAQELGLRHSQYVARDFFGLPFVNFMFERAQLLASHDTLVWINADIILVEAEELAWAIRQCSGGYDNGMQGGGFLMVCRRRNIDLDFPLDFGTDWRAVVRQSLADGEGPYSPCSSDLFGFDRPLWRMPPFRIGRPRWDNWQMWKACERGVPVVDATNAVHAAHPFHGYGKEGAVESYKAFHKWEESSVRNKELVTEEQKYCLKHVRQVGNLWRLVPGEGVVKV